jgi:hypothetical protein
MAWRFREIKVVYSLRIVVMRMVASKQAGLQFFYEIDDDVAAAAADDDDDCLPAKVGTYLYGSW